MRIFRGALLGSLVLFCGAARALYLPPACVAGQETFDDVPAGDPACRWIQKLWRDEIVDGCGPSLYCPDSPLTRRQAAVLLEKAMRGHLWGEGRANVTVYGNLAGLCDGAAGIQYGLSSHLATWDHTQAACPADYWVCTSAERGDGACNTLRPDLFMGCDRGACDGTCADDPADDQLGWVADASGAILRFGLAHRETTAGFGGQPYCDGMPVWCCRSR